MRQVWALRAASFSAPQKSGISGSRWERREGDIYNVMSTVSASSPLWVFPQSSLCQGFLSFISWLTLFCTVSFHKAKSKPEGWTFNNKISFVPSADCEASWARCNHPAHPRHAEGCVQCPERHSDHTKVMAIFNITLLFILYCILYITRFIFSNVQLFPFQKVSVLCTLGKLYPTSASFGHSSRGLPGPWRFPQELAGVPVLPAACGGVVSYSYTCLLQGTAARWRLASPLILENVTICQKA